MRVIKFIAIAAVLFFLSCSKMSTQQVLDTDFLPPSSRYFQIQADSLIYAGKPFYATVFALDTATSQVLKSYNGTLNWSVVGAGTLTVLSNDGWADGKNTFTLSYSDNLSPGQSAVIALSASDASDKKIRGTSNNITAKAPVIFSTYRITVPAQTYMYSPFTLKVEAMGSDGEVFQNYTGTALLTALNSSGIFMQTDGVTQITGLNNFVNGVSTNSVEFTQPHPTLQIKLTDSADSSHFAISSPVQVAIDQLGFSAIPISNANTLRLFWNSVSNATSYYVYEKQAGNWIALGTVSPPATSYLRNSLAAGTEYEYRLEARDASNTVLFASQTKATPAPCTTISAGMANNNIISTASWTYAASPYCVQDNVTISAQLTIEPGVAVRVAAGKKITVASGGTLVAQGSSARAIIFTADNALATPGYWGGIEWLSGSVGSAISGGYGGGSILSYSLVEFAGPGVAAIQTPLWIEYSLFRSNKSTNAARAGGGFYADLGGSGTNAVFVRYSGFSTNESTVGGGGALRIDGSGTVTIQYSSLTTNLVSGGAEYAAAAYIVPSSAQILSSYFGSNKAVVSADGGLNLTYMSGALLLKGNNNTISAVTFEKNQQTSSFKNTNNGTWTTHYSSGSLLLTGSGNTIQNSTFSNNSGSASLTATDGGNSLNVYNAGALMAAAGSLTLTQSLLSNNSAHSDATVGHKYAYAGGALLVAAGSSSAMTDNRFVSNSASASTEASWDCTQRIAYASGAINLLNASNDVRRNTFQNNSSTASSVQASCGSSPTGKAAGAILAHAQNNTINYNTFSGNTADGNQAAGGALLYRFFSGNNFSYNSITGNKSDQSGAVYLLGDISLGNLIASHNNITANGRLNITGQDRSLFLNASTTAYFQNTHWGGQTATGDGSASEKCSMLIFDSETNGGSSCTGSTSGTIDVTGAVATAWPLCSASSSLDCVGAP
ncbi:MAG: hypothetical protein LDLANPLL_02285 [Turneriella sp.]|nr:hypothetical protein [Turneriella sp.]